MPRKSERDVRIEILEQALKLAAGETANYFDEPELSIARELVSENLVTGRARVSGGVGVTGVRDAGREYLKAQRPFQKMKKVGKRALFLAYSAALVVAGYVAGLDSVKKALSDFIARFLH